MTAMRTLIKNATIVNEGQKALLDVAIENEFIDEIAPCGKIQGCFDNEIDATGLLLLPGVIDDQVHFREPGATQKADIYSESRAAAAGGVTSYMEMPNTNPPTINDELLKQKFDIAG